MNDLAIEELEPRLRLALFNQPLLLKEKAAVASVALEMTGLLACEGGFDESSGVRGVIRIHVDDSKSTTTTKPRNLVLDMGRLFQALSSTALDAFAAVAQPWLLPVVAMKVIGEWRRAATIDLTPAAAAIVWVLWSEDRPVARNRLDELVLEELARRGERASSEAIERALDQLRKSGCVDDTHQGNEGVELVLIERVKVSFE
jgi:hypothetical protein